MINFPDAPVLDEVFGPYVWDGVKWTTPVESGGGGGAASDALPLMAGVASPGTFDAYSRGDHQHPTDVSRAPLNAPVFSGGLTADTLTSGPLTINGLMTTNSGRIVARDPATPSICVYSVNRNYAMGLFLDQWNNIAFSGMDGNGIPNGNFAQIDAVGNFYLAGTIVLGRDPINWNDVATKNYADARNYGGAYLPLGGGWMGGNFISAQAWTGVSTAGGVGTVEIRSDGAGSDAFISFHQTARGFASNFGLASDHNMWFGGWSHGWASYRLWSTRDFGGFPTSNARMPHAADQFQANSTGLVESWGGAVITGMTGPSTYGVEYTTRWRYMQLFNYGWWTIGYA